MLPAYVRRNKILDIGPEGPPRADGHRGHQRGRLELFDFYQSRAQATPLGPLELLTALPPNNLAIWPHREPGGTGVIALHHRHLSCFSLGDLFLAQRHGWRVSHLRSRNGDHEIDLIVEVDGLRVLAIEVKLAGTVDDADVVHLNWLSERLGDRVVDKVVLTTRRFSYRARTVSR